MIRPLAEMDKESWRKLWRGYQAFYEVELQDGEDFLFERLLNPGPDGPFCLVYEDENGDLSGLVQFLYHTTTWSPHPRCYLNDLFTAADKRGKGVGRALIMAVKETAQQAGADQVYWLTQEFNEAGRRLYDKLAMLTPFIKYRM